MPLARGGQAIEDGANGETNAAWVDEDRAVNRRDVQQQRGRGRDRSDARALVREARGVVSA